MITPLIQATVNNGLARRNATSPYNEDLRTTLSMPILDWGIAFKPDKWLYPLVNGAYAYSFQWLFYLFAFVGGYALLFRRLGSAPVESFVLSLALFFTAFVQIWWTVFAPTVSVFPWILLALDIDNRIARATAIAWIGASWMLGSSTHHSSCRWDWQASRYSWECISIAGGLLRRSFLRSEPRSVAPSRSSICEIALPGRLQRSIRVSAG